MIVIHPRVSKRHPELADKDVRSAWENQYCAVLRETDCGFRYVAVGYDSRNREIEMVAIGLEDGVWLIYHAMTPPSAKTYDELGMWRRA